jgi:hypothetical protein
MMSLLLIKEETIMKTSVIEHFNPKKFREIENSSQKNFGHDEWHYTISANIVDYRTHKDICLKIEEVETSKEVVLSLWKLSKGQLDIIKEAIRLHEESSANN